jgi:hypothetical protein
VTRNEPDSVIRSEPLSVTIFSIGNASFNEYLGTNRSICGS